MQRGMISLTKAEISHTLSLLTQLDSAPPELEIRFTAALSETSDPVEVEINENILEAILDGLPMPSPDQDPIINSLRTKIGNNLRILRGVN
jgi:hypothetical protein